MHDIASMQALAAVSREQVREQLSTALALVPYSAENSSAPVVESKPGRGRPIKLAPAQLWLGLLWAVLEGVQGYSALARYLATHALGRFAPVSLTTSALLQRLQQAGYGPLQQLFTSLGSWLQTALAPPACTLAPLPAASLPWMRPSSMPWCGACPGSASTGWATRRCWQANSRRSSTS